MRNTIRDLDIGILGKSVVVLALIVLFIRSINQYHSIIYNWFDLPNGRGDQWYIPLSPLNFGNINPLIFELVVILFFPSNQNIVLLCTIHSHTVNNVGMSYDHAEFFGNLTDAKIGKPFDIYSMDTSTPILIYTIHLCIRSIDQIEHLQHHYHDLHCLARNDPKVWTSSQLDLILFRNSYDVFPSFVLLILSNNVEREGPLSTSALLVLW